MLVEPPTCWNEWGLHWSFHPPWYGVGLLSGYTVEQENFATRIFREFRAQAIHTQEIFVNFRTL